MRSRFVPLVILLTVPALSAESGLRSGALWYSNASPERIAQAAERSEVGITGPEHPEEKAALKALNPDFRWFLYNSGTDNYVPPHPLLPEYDLLVSRALDRGLDPEDLYLHYTVDTRVVLEGDTLLIPGWPDGSAVDPAAARIPVYTSTLTRRVANFSSPALLQIHKEVILALTVDTPFGDTGVYPDGIFLDNAASQLFNYGVVLEGGAVREADGNPLITSAAFQAWHWDHNLGPFLTALKDTLETSASWSGDGKRKYLMINVSNIWNDTYITRDVTDVLFLEFQYNPVRAFGIQAVENAYQRDLQAAQAGIQSFYSATMTRSVPPRPETYGYAETLLGNLAWYLVTRSPETLFFQMGTATPSTASWDTLTWRGCMDVADTLLGEAAAPPYRIAEGIDPVGNPYRVIARPYDRGLVLVRNRGDYDEGIEAETGVPVTLPRPMQPVDPEGAIGEAVSGLTLRNGQGAIFYDGTVPVSVLAFEAIRSPGAAILDWTVAGTGDPREFRIDRRIDGGERQPLATVAVTGARRYTYTDFPPPGAGALYWLGTVTRGGALEWSGPARLEAVADRRPLAVLPNHPNPFHSGTVIAFHLPEGGRIRLDILDVTGRQVAALLDADLEAGDHETPWDGRDLRGRPVAAGVYLARLLTPSGPVSRRLIRIPGP